MKIEEKNRLGYLEKGKQGEVVAAGDKVTKSSHTQANLTRSSSVCGFFVDSNMLAPRLN